MPSVSAIIYIDDAVRRQRHWEPVKFVSNLSGVLGHELKPIYGLRFPANPPISHQLVEEQMPAIVIKIDLPYSSDVEHNHREYESRLVEYFCDVSGLQRHTAILFINLAEETPRPLPRRVAVPRREF